MIIYAAVHPETKELRYVGKTERDLDVRVNEHRWSANSGKVTHFCCWWRSLRGVEPDFEILETVQGTVEDLNKAEIFWIDHLGTLGYRLTNHEAGGEGRTAGFTQPEAVREKISKSLKGRPNPGCAKAMKGNKHAAGTVKTREYREYLSRKMGGRPIQDQFGNRYIGPADAAHQLSDAKLLPVGILSVLKGRRKTHKGYVFTYCEQS